MRYILENLQPGPEQFASRIAERIAGDFRLSAQDRRDVERILADGHRLIMREVEANFSRIGMIEQGIAQRIAQVIPEGEARERWGAAYQDYFPRPPRPMPGMPGEGPGMPDGGPGMPGEPLRGLPMPPHGGRPGPGR